MTGPEHYHRAEQLAGRAHRYNTAGDPVAGAAFAAEAQVHATLALAAATALDSHPSSPSQMREWAAAIGDPYQEPEPDAAAAAPAAEEQEK